MEYRIDGPLEGHADTARVTAEPVGCSWGKPWCEPGESSEVGEGVTAPSVKVRDSMRQRLQSLKWVLIETPMGLSCNFKTHFM